MGSNQVTKGVAKVGALALQGATLQARRLRLPTVGTASETNLGLSLPVGAVVSDVFLDVKGAGGDTIHVGLNGTGADDDPDGFLASASVASVNTIRGTIAVAGAGTRGALLKSSIFSAASLAHAPTPHITTSVSPITYTLSTTGGTPVVDVIIVYLET